MQTKYLIPICFFIVCQAVYDFYAPSQSVAWSIFYFASMYISWLLLIIIIPKPANKIKKIPYFVLAGGISTYVMIQLSKIGMNYNKWLVSVNSFESIILPMAVIISGLTYFIIKQWQQ